MTPTVTVPSADLTHLVPLIRPLFQQINTKMIHDGVDQLTVPDSIRSQVVAILNDPTWRTKGLQSVLTNYAALARYNRESAGIVVAGFVMPTDRDSQSRLHMALLHANSNPAAVVSWKMPDSGFVDLTGDQLRAIAAAVASYVQRCFTMEKQVVNQIKAGQITSTLQIETAFSTVSV